MKLWHFDFKYLIDRYDLQPGKRFKRHNNSESFHGVFEAFDRLSNFDLTRLKDGHVSSFQQLQRSFSIDHLGVGQNLSSGAGFRLKDERSK